MPDRTGIFLGWSANLSNFLGLGVEAGASPMYPQKMRVPPPRGYLQGNALGGYNKGSLIPLINSFCGAHCITSICQF